MPWKKKTATKKPAAKKRIYKRKHRLAVSNKGTTTKVGEPLRNSLSIPLPLRYRVKFRYCSTHIVQSGTSGTLSSSPLRFNLSSLYDPDNSGGGHQPYGYDQFTAMYEKYKVYKAKVTLQWFDVGATNTGFCCAALRPSTSGTGIASLTYPYYVEKQVGGSVCLTSTGNNRVVEQNIFVDLRKIVGVTRAQYNDAQYEANYNANPSTSVYLELASAFPSSANAIDVNVAINIEYYGVMWDRVPLTVS